MSSQSICWAFLALFLRATGSWAECARVGSLVQQAPPEARLAVNPLAGDADASRAGAKLYERECATCHGRTGAGQGRIPALTGLDVTRATPGALFWVLRNGSLNRGMPSFSHLPEAQRWQIVRFLESLAPSQQEHLK